MSSGSLPLNAVRVRASMDVRLPSREESHIFGHGTDGLPSQKRERDAEAMKELLKTSIVIKPHPTKLSVKPRTLQPLMLLPREYLRLSFLDLSLPYGSFESSRSFESSIKILELEGRLESHPVVVIARLESDKTIYALERETNGLYTLCHVGSWVDLQELERLATVSLSQFIGKRSNTSVDTNTSHPLTTPHLHHETKKRRLAIEAIQSLVKKPTRSRSLSTASQIIPPECSPTQPTTPGRDDSESQLDTAHISQNAGPTKSHETQAQSQAPEASVMDDLLATPTAEGIFDNIRNQYFESLYNSMGSLAYFAKGPLSRARAAFHLDCDSNLDMNDLVDFLASLVMTTTQFDKKYRETIPNIISKMKSILQDSDAEQGNSKRKRKSKKMKIGKDGLYPTECDRIKKWWSARMPQFKEEEAMTSAEPHESKLQIAWLRSRETQLQMIVILEILALEPLLTPRDGKDAELPGLPGFEEAAMEMPKDGPAKKRNRIRNTLPLLVDIHADRLCIWQSTALDEVRLPAGDQARKDPDTQEAPRTTSDPLKDFCVDVIVPFFSARLLEKADHLCRKFGGPPIMPPPKSKPKKSEKPVPVTKPKPKPGSAAKRLSSSKPSGTLESVLSEETVKHRRSMSRGPSGAIALMRSASTTMLKRENSEPLSLTSIPRADSVSSKGRPSRSTVTAPPKRRLEEEKAKKDALVKAELQNAISLLRRPNRDVVGKDIAEAAERRAGTSLSQLKKSRKPTQHPRVPDIVKATPVGKRFTDALDMSVGNRPSYSRSAESNGLSTIPSSSLIPSSGPRKRSHEAAFTLDECRSIPRSRASAGRVEATPVKSLTHKQSFMSVPEVDNDAVLASSPIILRKSSSTMSFRDSGIEMDELTETPVKSRAVPVPSEGIVATTPTKRRILDSTTANSNKATVGEAKEPGRKMSIYERLGWDDDDLDELG
ncbi:DNA replication regulator SLD3-domain-containing protein [Hypoxylon sp. FL0543]|nr:DNA replication regulator SLD3-domain-containing protein [Hypoxylon sp. FL0543]